MAARWQRLKLKKAVDSASALLLVAGIYSLLFSFVSFTAGDPRLDDDPFSANFTLTDTSTLFTLRNIYVGCLSNSVKFANRVVSEHNDAIGQSPTIPELLPANPDTVNCVSAFRGGKVVRADVTIELRYGLAVDLGIFQVPLPFIKKTSASRFVTSATSENKFKWFPYGLKDATPNFVPLPGK
jgi:hypothetical protein